MYEKFENLVQLNELVEQLDEPYAAPVFARGHGETISGDNFRAVVSSKDNKILSVMSKRYGIVQSKDVLKNVLLALHKLGISEVSGKVVEQNGKTFATIMLPKYISEGAVVEDGINKKLGHQDKAIQLGFLLTNSYDGTTAISLRACALRLVCSNGMVVSATIGSAFVRKHTRNVALRIESAVREIIQTIVDRSPYLQAQIEKAIQEQYASFKEADEELTALGFSKKTIDNVYDKLEKTENFSKWELYNAVTNYFTFKKKMKENSRIQNLKRAEQLLAAPLSGKGGA